MYMKKQERKEKKKISSFADCPGSRQSWAPQPAKPGLPTAFLAVGKAFADCQEKSSRESLFRLPGEKQSVPTAFLLAVGKAFADCFSPGSRESLCRLPGRRSAKETGRDGDGVFTDWLYGRRGSLYRLLSGRQSEKNSFPTSSLPAPLCRLPRRKTVGKAFADRFSAFADCFRQSAKRPIPVVRWVHSDSFYLCVYVRTFSVPDVQFGNEFSPRLLYMD